MLKAKSLLAARLSYPVFTGPILPSSSIQRGHGVFLPFRVCSTSYSVNHVFETSSYRTYHSRSLRIPVEKHSLQDVLSAKRRKIKRDETGRQKLASILNLRPKNKDLHDEIKSVDDLKKVLPSMPYEQQVKVSGLIEEYGDMLNSCFKNVTELTNENSSGKTKSVNNQQTSEYSAAIDLIQKMVEEIIMLEQEGDNLASEKTYSHLWKNVKLFSQMESDPEVDPPLELLVILFQLAKNQNRPKIKTRSLRLVGDILYGLNLVRLDPYNEVDYLNALASTQKRKKAIKIWESRLSKEDVKDSIWWAEVGCCLYQDAYDVKKAENLASELINKHDYVPPKVVLRFIKLYLETGKSKDLWKWCDHLISQVEKSGHLGEEVNIIGDMEPEEAELLFNQKTIPTEKDMIELLNLIIKFHHSTYILKAIDRVKAVGVDIPSNMFAEALRKISQNSRLLDDIHSSLAAREIHELENEKGINSPVVADNLVDRAACILLKINPELATNQNFYQKWIRGLVWVGRVDRVIELLKEIPNDSVMPTKPAILYVLKSLLNKGQVSKAFEFLNEVKESKARSEIKLDAFFPSSTDYSIFLRYAAHHRNKHLISLTLQQISLDLKNFDESIFLALAQYLHQANDFLSFRKLLAVSLQAQPQAFSTKGYKAIWTIIRDNFRKNPEAITSFTNLSVTRESNKNDFIFQALKVPGSIENFDKIDVSLSSLKSLVSQTLRSKGFVSSLSVYEPIFQTLLLSHKHIIFFALLDHVSKNTQLVFDPSFSIRLTKLAEKMNKIKKINPTMVTRRSPSIPPMLFSSTEVQNVAMNNFLAQNGTSATIPAETLTKSIAMALEFDYENHRDVIEKTATELVASCK